MGEHKSTAKLKEAVIRMRAIGIYGVPRLVKAINESTEFKIKTDNRKVQYVLDVLKSESNLWVNDLAQNGFIDQIKVDIESLMDIELELQEIRTSLRPLEDDDDKVSMLILDSRIKIMHEITYIKNIRLETLGNGPATLGMRKVEEGLSPEAKKIKADLDKDVKIPEEEIQ